MNSLFVSFLPQLVERILKFPVAKVKSTMATTRPMVLTTRRSSEESVQVKEDVGDVFGDFQTLLKDQVMDWVASQMTGGIKSSQRPQLYESSLC
jgi:hypothetical protein